MGVWAREDDSVEKMNQVVAEYRRDIQERHDLLVLQVGHLAKLLRTSAKTGGMPPETCEDLATLIESELL